MDIKTPPHWRKGQTIFNFLQWLKEHKNYPAELDNKGRMADPFYIPDDQFVELFEEFLTKHSYENN